MKSITKIERDDYLVLPNPDLVNEYKVINFDYVVGSGERALFFGELQVNAILRIEGELNVLRGNLYVGISPSGLSYSNIIVNQNGSVNSIPTLSQGSTPITYTVSPSLPSGLSIDSSTGVISGTPTSSQSLTSYTVTATNSLGNTTATINITVNSVIAPSSLSYNSGQTAIPLISTSVSYSPTLSAGTSPTYSVSPSLPSGLSLNTSNGIISGTTPATSNDTTYTITATNGAGSTTASFRIRIVFLNTTITVGNQGIDVYDSESGYYISVVGYAQLNRGGYGSIPSRNFNGTTIELLNMVEERDSTPINQRINFSLMGNMPNSNSTFSKITINNNTIVRENSNMIYGGYSSGQNATNMWWDTINSYSWFKSLNGTTVPLIIE